MAEVPSHRVTPRLYHPQLPHPRLAERPCLLDPEQSRHVRKVLRRGEGDRIELFDGEGGLAQAVIAGFDGSRAACRVEHLEHHEPPAPRITVAAAMPKGTRPDDMVDQLSQVGADRFVPLLTERGVVNPRAHKIERLQRQAVEAAKQCGRLHLLQVEAAVDFETALSEPADLRLIASIGGQRLALAERLTGVDAQTGQRVPPVQSVQVLVGPEGGWTEHELARAEQAGALRWSLGGWVMRIETAAPSAVAVLRYLSSPA